MAVVDIGDKEAFAGTSIVGYSRAQSLECLAVDPAPTLERLKRIRTGAQMSRRKRHDAELSKMAAETQAAFHQSLVDADPMLFGDGAAGAAAGAGSAAAADDDDDDDNGGGGGAAAADMMMMKPPLPQKSSSELSIHTP